MLDVSITQHFVFDVGCYTSFCLYPSTGLKANLFIWKPVVYGFVLFIYVVVYLCGI